jgi:hypothetical protein
VSEKLEMTLTLAEFQALTAAIRRQRPGTRIRLGAPAVASEGADKVRCRDCGKLAWDCRCENRR